jgi:coenzyme F420-reducing hydrogenase delta subunit
MSKTQQLLKDKGIDPARLKMAAICSVCSEPFVKHVKSFTEYLKSSN